MVFHPLARSAVQALAATLLLAPPNDAGAQSVRGMLLDAMSGDPLAGASVSLVGPDGVRQATAVSDAAGRFRLTVSNEGQYSVQIQRVGYRMVRDGPFELAAGQEREATYRLAPVAVELEAIEVEAERVAGKAMLTRVGFYERQKSDFGRFITRDLIEERRARRFTDLLRTIPGVRINPSAGGLSRSGVQLRGSQLSHGGVCAPRVFIDGTIVIRGDARPKDVDRQRGVREEASEQELPQFERNEIAIDDVVMPDDIEAIEVYRSAAQIPARFGGASRETQCGVIVIWTRRGGQDRP
jgi:hypothetical protein